MSEPKKSQTESNSIFDGHGDGLDRMRQSQQQEVASRRHFVLKWSLPALVVAIIVAFAVGRGLYQAYRHVEAEPPMMPEPEPNTEEVAASEENAEVDDEEEEEDPERIGLPKDLSHGLQTKNGLGYPKAALRVDVYWAKGGMVPWNLELLLEAAVDTKPSELCVFGHEWDGEDSGFAQPEGTDWVGFLFNGKREQPVENAKYGKGTVALAGAVTPEQLLKALNEMHWEVYGDTEEEVFTLPENYEELGGVANVRPLDGPKVNRPDGELPNVRLMESERGDDAIIMKLPLMESKE